MEYSTNIIDPHDELRKLQDKVRRLEIQNEQLRSQKSNRNGLIEELGCENVPEAGDNVEINLLNTSLCNLDTCQVIDVDKEDHLDHEKWLYGSLTGQRKDAHLDIQAVLQQNINNNDNEFQAMRRGSLQRIEDLKQGTLKSIDTRTFTRPKKRISRPALETMLESPILENRQLMSSPWFAKKNMQFLGDNIEDVSMMLDSTLSSLTSEPENLNQTFRKMDLSSINSSPHKSGLQGFVKKENSVFHLSTENLLLNSAFQRLNVSGQSNHMKSKEQGNINTTNTLKQDESLLSKTMLLPAEPDVALESTALNCTFSVVDGCGSSGSSRRSARTASCESGLDEDQLSSASDSSYSSASKPMNVGDVQIIAHIQEESLKQANSTPVRGYMDGSFSNLGEDLPSPIVHTSFHEANHGYQSDHSDHSSADSRAKSSRSSIRSSPSSSPCGSTNLLTNVNDNGQCQFPTGLASRELEPIGTAVLKTLQKPTAPVLRQPENLRPRGLQPPSIRPPSVGVAQPQGRRVSGIPRLPSRLPGPRTRSLIAARPINKNNAMRGHY